MTHSKTLTLSIDGNVVFNDKMPPSERYENDIIKTLDMLIKMCKRDYDWVKKKNKKRRRQTK